MRKARRENERGFALLLVFAMAAAVAASYVPARRILKQTPGRTLRDI